MLNKAYIEQRAEHRQEIERQVSEFLSRGGKIDVRQPGESAIPEKVELGMRNGQYKKSHEYAMRAEAARFEGEGYV